MSGLDKHSKDHSILLWDINKGLQTSERVHHHNTVQTDSMRPIAEVGVSETIHSIAWFKHEQKCMVVGTNNKQLKIIDFRGIIIKQCHCIFFIRNVICHIYIILFYIRFCKGGQHNSH